MINRRFAVSAILALLATGAIGARAASTLDESLTRWIETDRQVYGPNDAIGVALCIRNDGAQDIGLLVDPPAVRVRVDGAEAPRGTVTPAGEPSEIILPVGEVRVFAQALPARQLRLAAGPHRVVAVLQPAGGEPLEAEGSFELLPLETGLRVADVIAAPNIWRDGEFVELKGEYRSNVARPLRPLDGVAAPRLTDWILGDETGEVYVRNSPVAEGNYPRSVQDPVPPDHVDLHPEWSYGARVVVRGTVLREADGAVSIDPLQVFKWQSDRGAFCVLETAGPTSTGEHAGEMLLRMILKNDTKYPIRFASPAGYLCDFIVERDGVEVWRWSKQRWTGEGIRWYRVEDESWKLNQRPGDASLRDENALRDMPLFNIPPDNSFVRVVYWPLVDNDGRPVPPGVYHVSAMVSHRIYSYPLPVEVGHPAADAE